MLKLVAANAAEKLISEGDVPPILQSWLDGAGPTQESTQKKLRSNILVMMKAGALPKVAFISTIEKAAKMHADKAKTKQKPAQLNELYLSLAREQIKNDGGIIAGKTIREKLVAPKSRRSGAAKPAPVERMVKAVPKLSAAEFKQLVKAVRARLGVEDRLEDAEDNPIRSHDPICRERQAAAANGRCTSGQSRN
jgi:hypothetical protein